MVMRTENEARSPQPPTTSAIGSITAENVISSPNASSAAGHESPTANYHDQPDVPLPSSSRGSYNIDPTAERKAAWTTYCKKNAWRVGRKAGDPAMHHFPRGTETLPEHAVKKWVNPILTDLELATLMSKSNKNSRTKLYSIKSLLAFILKRSSELGIDIVASIRLQEESLQGPLQLRHYDPPLRYFRTSNDPPKGDIVFDNEVLPVDTRTLSIDDASLIYAIPRKRLMALHAWHTELDITTVAIIALERRGGFHFHNNRIVKRRRKAIRRLRRVRFATEGVHLYGRNAWQVCERLLGPLPTGAIGLGENNVDPTNRRMYVKQYLPVGCVVVRDENNVLRPRHWFHGSLNYPLDEVLDLTLAIPTK